MPSLTDNLNPYINQFNNKIIEDSYYQGQKVFLSKNKLKRKINLSEKKKLFYGDFRAYINLSNKSIFDFKYNNKKNNNSKLLNNSNIRKNGSKSFKCEEKNKI